MTHTDYDQGFFRHQERTSHMSAKQILTLVQDITPFSTVVDFGCGSGAWLRAAKTLGVTTATGIDGPWVAGRDFASHGIEFVVADLEKAVGLDRTYDLCMSVEVAEHLSERRAASFVDELCAASRRVLFGAAVPMQGGTRHINEQWQSYWAKLFAANSYYPVDLVRANLTDERDVLSWYRNNAFLYVPRSDLEVVIASAVAKGYATFTLDGVTREIYLDPSMQYSLYVLRRFPSRLVRSLAWRLDRWTGGKRGAAATNPVPET